MSQQIDIDGVPIPVEATYFSVAWGHTFSDQRELAKLKQLHQLRSVSMCGSNLDDDGLAGLCRNRAITHLDLQETQITNAGLAALASLTSLTMLRLKDNPQLTSECMPHLSALRSLEHLGIQETGIDERGLAALRPLIDLRMVVFQVENGNFGYPAVREISQALPRCEFLAKGTGSMLAGEGAPEW